MVRDATRKAVASAGCCTMEMLTVQTCMLKTDCCGWQIALAEAEA